MEPVLGPRGEGCREAVGQPHFAATWFLYREPEAAISGAKQCTDDLLRRLGRDPGACGPDWERVGPGQAYVRDSGEGIGPADSERTASAGGARGRPIRHPSRRQRSPRISDFAAGLGRRSIRRCRRNPHGRPFPRRRLRPSGLRRGPDHPRRPRVSARLFQGLSTLPPPRGFPPGGRVLRRRAFHGGCSEFDRAELRIPISRRQLEYGPGGQRRRQAGAVRQLHRVSRAGRRPGKGPDLARGQLSDGRGNAGRDRGWPGERSDPQRSAVYADDLVGMCFMVPNRNHARASSWNDRCLCAVSRWR